MHFRKVDNTPIFVNLTATSSGTGKLLLGSGLHGNAIFVIADPRCKIQL
jgi:hypothetical protein